MFFLAKYKLINFFFCCSFLLHANFSSSQNDLKFEHFTSENGLSENFVYSIYQDKKGFLWIGTHDGLNRYDGYNFKKFRHNPADKNSLPDNTIYSIAEDTYGNLWLGTNAGLCQFNPSTGIARNITLQNKLKTVEQIIFLNEEELLIKHDKSLRLFNVRTQKELSLSYKASNGLLPLVHTPSPITKDRTGNIYIIKDGSGQIAKYDRDNKWFAEFVSLPVPAKYSAAAGVLLFFYDSRDQYWLTIAEKETFIFKDSGNAKPEKLHTFPSKAVRQIFEDKDGNTWIASTAGLIYHDRAGNTRWYKQNIELPASISSDDVQAIFQDRTGIIWIATSNGLNKLNPFQKKIGHLVSKRKSQPGLYNNFVMGIYPEGPAQLRIHYNIYENHQFTRYNLADESLKHYDAGEHITADYLKQVMIKNPETLTPGLLQLIVDFYKNKYHVLPTEGLAGNIWIDRLHQVWSDEGRILTCLNTSSLRLMDTSIAFTQLSGNDLWIGSSKGLIEFNTVTKKTVNYHTGSNGSNSISSNDITCFLFASDGNIWIATKGGGLNFFDRMKKIFRHFTEKDGLCNNSIYCMVMDDKGRLWLGTSLGLSVFDPTTQKFKNFFKADGLVNNEYNRYSACKLPDGTVFMGGMNGIDYFHPDSLLINDSKPVIQFTDFKLFNQSINNRSISSFRHNENFITIEFATMDFNNPKANKFAYKLEEADNDWVFVEGRNFATYSHLQPGNYRFLVRAANSQGVWNDDPIIYEFTILPPWYRTWWFFGLSVIVIASVLYLLFRYRLQQKLKVLQIRNRLHRNLHDDVGATLSSVKVYSEILGKNGNSEIISGLIRENADDMISKLEVISWATNPHYDNFKSLVDAMMKFARPLTHANNIELQFEKTGFGDETIIPGDIRQNIFLIFKEAINNMVKYADATKCHVTLKIKNQRLILQIMDNGKGYDGIIKGGGSGLKNMQKRAEEMNGKFEIETAPEKGTLVRLSAPRKFTTKNLG